MMNGARSEHKVCFGASSKGGAGQRRWIKVFLNVNIINFAKVDTPLGMSMISDSMVFYGFPIKIAMKMGSLTPLFVEPAGKNRYVKYEEHMGLGGVGWGNRSKRSNGRQMGSRSRRIRRSRKNRSRR